MVDYGKCTVKCTVHSAILRQSAHQTMQTSCEPDTASLVCPSYLCHVTNKGLANFALGRASNPDLHSVQALAAGKCRAACELESGCWHH